MKKLSKLVKGGKGEGQIMKPTNEGKMKSPSEMSDAELREAVAVEVMGWRLVDLIPGGHWWFEGKRPVASVNDPDGGGPPLYESSIEAAFEVVAKMRTILNRWGGQNRLLLEQKPDGMFKAAFYGDATNWEASAWVDAAAAPRAICIAALTAVRARKT